MNARIFYTRFFDIAKKASPEQFGLPTSYTRRDRKTIRKRATKTRSGIPPERVGKSISYISRMFANFQK